MPYSLILIDLNNRVNISECYNYFCNYLQDFEILYCTNKKSAVPSHMVINYIFEDTNIECILNATVSICKNDNVVIIRNALDYKKAIDLIKNHNKNNQIVYLKKKQTKFSSLKLKMQKLIGNFFVHKIYDIDYSVTLYGEITSKVLKNITAPSVLTKTNNWTGIEMVGVAGDGKYKFAYNKKRLALKTLVPIGIAVALIPLFFIIRPKTFRTIKVIYLLVILILFAIGGIFGSKWILNSIVGENITNKAKILNEKGE